MIERLEALIADWPHERDAGYEERPRGSGNWVRLWDSGCHELCHRCKIEAFINGYRQDNTSNP